MIDRSNRTDGAAAAGRAARMLAVLLCCLVWSVVRAADDAYLELLDAEVTKVRGPATDTGGDAAAVVHQGDVRQPASRERFEALLRERHIGTYSFYRRLPERSRAEIFLNYAQGEAMDMLRDKIVDRYLHP